MFHIFHWSLALLYLQSIPFAPPGWQAVPMNLFLHHYEKVSQIIKTQNLIAICSSVIVNMYC